MFVKVARGWSANFWSWSLIEDSLCFLLFFFSFLDFFFFSFLFFFFFFFFSSSEELDELSEEEEEESSDEASPSSDAEDFSFFLVWGFAFRINSPQFTILISCKGLSFLSVSKSSISLTTSLPPTTWPKITWRPSRWGAGAVVMKNWEPLVFFPRSETSHFYIINIWFF